MLDSQQSVLVVVDVQGRLASLMDKQESLFHALQQMIKGSQLFDLPVLWVEQLPDKLGRSIPQISDLLGEQQPIVKSSFSAMGCDDFCQQLTGTNRKQVLLVGIEAHICVYQTAVELLNQGYEVHLVVDAVGSRLAANRQLAINKLERMGAHLTCVEMALFELQREADGDRFRALSRLVK